MVDSKEKAEMLGLEEKSILKEYVLDKTDLDEKALKAIDDVELFLRLFLFLLPLLEFLLFFFLLLLSGVLLRCFLVVFNATQYWGIKDLGNNAISVRLVLRGARLTFRGDETFTRKYISFANFSLGWI